MCLGCLDLAYPGFQSQRESTMHESLQIAYIVFNTIDPYGLEIIRFLACPEGSQCVVRFKAKWMPTIHEPGELTGKHGVLVLRD